MAFETRMITFERMVSAPPTEVYRAFVKPAALRDWLCNAAQTDAREGGRLYLWWNDGSYVNGTFTRLVPGRQLEFTWHGSNEPAPTRVQVTIAPQAECTLVSLIHQGIGATEVWADTGRSLEEGWPDYLENLQSLLETGVDLREARRPFLGFAGGEPLDAGLAARLGVPASAGIVVAGVFPGSGLEAAGMRKDDVIVSLDGGPVPGWEEVGAVLQRRRAGDQIELLFYREGQRQSATVTLSGRPPQPEAPPSAAALAEATRAAYAQLDGELAACLDGVSEEAAGHHPASGEWSAKESIAHLIACERDFQAWIAAMLLDLEVEDSLEYRPNVLPRLAALVAERGDVPALLAELRHSAAETAALLAALPDEFVGRKHQYRRISYWATDALPEHAREHMAQMREALAAA